MTTQLAGIDPATLPAQPTGGRSITCPLCNATPGVECMTPSGRRARYAHLVRYRTWASRARSEDYLVRVRADDDRLGLRAGEVYLAESYWLDPGLKCTLKARVPDGHEPECNQYHRGVEWLGFAADIVRAA